MDDQLNPNAEFTRSSTCEPESPFAATRHGSGMFSNSQQFTVTGGTFTNVTHKNYAAAPSLPSDFRMIPMGDIDLRHRIRVNERMSVAFSRPRERARVRRLYSAKVEGRKSTLTVAMYQGDNAAQNQEFKEAFYYLWSAFQRAFYSSDCTNWIRRSTGRLCAELTPANHYLWLDVLSPESPVLPGEYSLNAGADITKFIDSLTLEQYHGICATNLVHHRWIPLSADITVNLRAVFCYSSDPLEDSDEIAFLPSRDPILYDWSISGGGTGEVMPNGWTRDVFSNTLSIGTPISGGPDLVTWLSQANHIFRRLHIVSNFEDYGLTAFEFSWTALTFTFMFRKPQETLPRASYSYVHDKTSAPARSQTVGQLAPHIEEATALGYPSFKLTTRAWGYSWDTSVYDGLRQFHEAKGFDPYSQDVARHLGYLFFRLFSESDALSWDYVDSDDEDFDADIDSDCRSTYTEDYESEYPPSSTGDDSDVEAESLHSEKDARDPAGESRESEHAEFSTCANHNASQSTMEEDMVAEELFVPSPTFRIVLYIQLTAISFLALSGVHHHVW
ncbi:hypothetical protein MSAN_00121500 [Mycena sanguinolenta]|uniref:Uncharacterized protein n=1 Tax=Mycena sanguinolenta TaxID=230812 RepID=A0A8H7DIW1_9AGAR|nr:hypothetical protein MSAN_00121500 [Mycena sanguinolenta]